MTPDVSTADLNLAPTLLSSSDRVDMACDAFEEAWIRGERPIIAEFLGRGLERDRSLLFSELLLLDIDYRRQRGEAFSTQEYKASFPDLAAQIESVGFLQQRDDAAHADRDARGTDATCDRRYAGRFELIEKLGAGASGEVWKAVDPRLERCVALEISHAGAGDAASVRRFLREARAAAQLRHPHLVSVHEVGREGEAVFIVSDLINGVDLRQRLAADRFSHRQAAEICATVAEALHVAHDQGIVHRDLKPANIIIDDDGRPHVTDFGLAKWFFEGRSVTLNGQLVGTPAYMSPEQARGDVGQIDRRTDVYGLGAVLYELLTGRPPYAGDLATIVHQIIRDEPRAPRRICATVPRDLETICLKAMAKEPACRYGSAQEMAVDLRRFLRGEPILARPDGPFERCWRFFRRRPTVAAAIVLGVVAFGSLASLGVAHQRHRALLGFKTVTLTTDPPGAEVVFVPLNEGTGKPEPSRIVRAGRSPIRQDFPAGHYLVIAVHGDDSTPLEQRRFHEVQRTVPADVNAIRPPYNHLYWEVLGPEEVEIPSIKIPERDAIQGMGLVSDRAAGPAFYIDTSEFDRQAYSDRIYDGQITASMARHPKPADAPIHANFDQAMMLLELAGRRLPTSEEYQRAWLSRRGSETKVDVAPDPAEENLSGNQSSRGAQDSSSLRGLEANPREWTVSWAPPFDLPGDLSVLDDVAPVKRLRAVWDGRYEPTDKQSPSRNAIAPPLQREDRSKGARSIGFRGARSAAPPYFH